MISSCRPNNDLALILRNMKSFTALKLIDAIIKNPGESRKEHLQNAFEAKGKKSSSNFRFKFWEHENHPVLLDSTFAYNQRLDYSHDNPVRAGFVKEPWHWKLSSATDYFTSEKGLLDLVILE
jgi:putative transposase